MACVCRDLNVTANGLRQRQELRYQRARRRALLTAGDFQLNNVQLVGGVMGTGSDFRWIGELRAAAERSYGTTITGLILQDARAEMNDGVLTASSSQFTCGSLAASGTRVNGITATDLRLRSEERCDHGSRLPELKRERSSLPAPRSNGVTANNIDIASRDGVTSVVVKDVQVGATAAAGAEIGSINIAGVRLSVRGGRVEGSTADINAGTVKLADGQVENVKLAKPVFVVEPSGRYRASADLSIGGGVLGQMNMGQASAQAGCHQHRTAAQQLRRRHLSRNGKWQRENRNRQRRLFAHQPQPLMVSMIAGPFTAFAGAAVPLAGRASGKVDLAFPGTDFQQATGTISHQLYGRGLGS